MQFHDTALCQCGCGLPAPTYAQGYTKLGVRKGDPRRFRVGHNRSQRAQTPYVLSEDGLIAKIPLVSHAGVVRAYAVIDATDANWVGQWTWRLIHAYAGRGIRRADGITQTIMLHRELLGLTDGDVLTGDHINRNTLDNRRANLRVVHKGAQRQNTPSHQGSSSRYRGVSRNKNDGLWWAKVTVNGKQTHLGRFKTEDEAAEAARTGRARLLPFAVD